MLYAAAMLKPMRLTTLPVRALRRKSVPSEPSAQIERNPDATAMTGRRSDTDFVVLPVFVLTRITRDCCLHAIQAESPRTASVIVGQYAPAPAQILIARAPGRLASPAAALAAAIANAAI